MKIQIQAYWNAEVSSIDSAAFHKKGITPEKYLEENPKIHICDIAIDRQVVGTVAWDGKELTIDKQLSIHKSLEQQIQELWASRGLEVLEENVETIGENKVKWTIIAKRIEKTPLTALKEANKRNNGVSRRLLRITKKRNK